MLCFESSLQSHTDASIVFCFLLWPGLLRRPLFLLGSVEHDLFRRFQGSFRITCPWLGVGS
jgi:hypothetical protein